MTKKFILKEGTISIAGVQLQIRDGAVNPEDQSPEGMDLLQKIANAVNGGENVQINLPGQPAAGGVPGAMPPEGAMGDGGPLEPGGDMGGGPEIGTEGPPEMGALPPEQEFEPHFPGETPEEHEEHEEAESPEEEASEHAEGESEADESEGEEEEEEGEDEEDEGGEEDNEEGPPKKGPEKGKNPFADDINRIAACITEDINVNNGIA
jgi:hypothetical protein